MTTMWRRRLVVPLALSLLFVFGVAGPNYATHDGDAYDGCTARFWKERLDHWGPTGLSTTQTLGSVGFVFPASIASLADATLFDALNFPGGLTLVEAAKGMMRQAVAALLNTLHPDVPYLRENPQHVIREVNLQLSTQDNQKYLNYTAKLENWNDKGCPLK